MRAVFPPQRAPQTKPAPQPSLGGLLFATVIMRVAAAWLVTRRKVCYPLRAEPKQSTDPMEERIVVYTTDYCPYCKRAKELLQKKHMPFREVDVAGQAGLREWLFRETGRKTVPQIFIDGQPIGGFDDLASLDRSGKLDAMWEQVPSQLT